MIAVSALEPIQSKVVVPKRAQVGMYFGLWYALNVYYNVQNKKILRLLPKPWLVAAAQLLVGALYSNVVRSQPRHKYVEVLPIAVAHGAGQACTVISLGAGAVSSAHVVKALEPLFSAAVNTVVTGIVLNPLVYLSLVPVIFGVALAVAKDLEFSPLSFGAAMGSNLFFAVRAVLSKQAMHDVSPAALFGVVTTVAAALMTPVALLVDGGSVPAKLLPTLLLSGLFHYLNNEVMYVTLSKVHPVTLAIGNTLKRIVIVVAALLFLGETMRPLAAVGAAIAIAGTFLYAILKQRLA